MRWRERLAQVAEWSGRPGEALEHWLFIARRTGQRDRVAGGDAHRAGPLRTTKRCSKRCATRRARARRSPTTSGARSSMRTSASAGRAKAIEFLEQEYARRPRPALLESIAYLKERIGRRRRRDRGVPAASSSSRGRRPSASRRSRRCCIARGEFKEAYDLLERYRAKVPPEDAEYLRLLGDLALRLQDDTAAQATYERLVAHPKARAGRFHAPDRDPRSRASPKRPRGSRKSAYDALQGHVVPRRRARHLQPAPRFRRRCSGCSRKHLARRTSGSSRRTRAS